MDDSLPPRNCPSLSPHNGKVAHGSFFLVPPCVESAGRVHPFSPESGLEVEHLRNISFFSGISPVSIRQMSIFTLT